MSISFPSRRWAANHVLISAAILVLSLAIAPAGCKRHRRGTVQTGEETPAPASGVAPGGPQVAKHLVGGCDGGEQNSWRWTAGRFSVLLRPPRTAAVNGAVLQLKFAIPD